MLDLRLPIGWLFIIIGTALTYWGCMAPDVTMLGETSINLNVTWGSFMGVFGVVMCLLAYRNHSAG